MNKFVLKTKKQKRKRGLNSNVVVNKYQVSVVKLLLSNT